MLGNLTNQYSLKNLVTPALFAGLLIASVMIALLIGAQGIATGLIIVGILAGVPMLFVSVVNVQIGFNLLVWYSYFLFLLGRLLPIKLPVGIGMEVIEGALLFGIFAGEIKRGKPDWANFKNPVTYALFIYEGYNLLEAFNPNQVSLTGWLVAVRSIVFDLVTYYIVVKILSNFEIVKKFTKLWLALALLAALYGIWQEVFGYADFEWRDINSDPQTITLIQNWGILRKFSFLSDVATFGILMAIVGVFCTVLALGPFSWRLRAVLAFSALLMFVSMSYSGTRTATAVVPVGLLLYVLMHINNQRTLIVVFIATVGFVVILFGPFYGGVVTRIRTTFQPGTDASMNVREYNRKRIQPYIHEHPIGGGLNTTDGEGLSLAAGHPLAGFATDSGYLKSALTTGWIGLLVIMGLYFTVIAIGVKNFYRARDPQIKAFYAAYIAMFFALLIANYAQSAMIQKPTFIIVFSIFAIMPNMIKWDTAKMNGA